MKKKLLPHIVVLWSVFCCTLATLCLPTDLDGTTRPVSMSLPLDAARHSANVQADLPATYSHLSIEPAPIDTSHNHCDGAHTHSAAGDRIWFEANKGQFDARVRYRAQLPNAYLFAENNCFTWLLLHADDLQAVHDCKHAPNCNTAAIKIRQHALRMSFLNAHHTPTLSNSEPAPHYRNYLKGNNPQQWQTSVPLYAQLDYAQLYDGIALRLYTRHDALKYDLIVSAGSNTDQIRWHYEGADSVWTDKGGNLHVGNSINDLIEQAPLCYQIIAGKPQRVAARFDIRPDKSIGFAFPDGYNRTYDLVIDPSVVFSSYTGSVADNWGTTATPAADGSFYLGSIAFTFGYPVTTGAFDASFNGGDTDISISKFTANGNNLLYSTYIGGGRSEFPHSLIEAANADLLILGTTASSNYPTTPTSYDTNFNGGDTEAFSGINYMGGSDIVVTRLNAAGTGLIGSTYLGGSNNDGLNNSILRHNYSDEARGEIMTDAAGNVYIASCTKSDNFPMVNGFQNTSGGDLDACIVKFTADLSDIVWSSYLGGSEDDAAYSVKIDPADGDVFVGGGTRSSNFFDGANGFDTSQNGGEADGFIARISANGSAVLNATYLGTTEYDQAYFIEFDEALNIYAFGQTSGNYPVSSGVYSNANSGQFIHCLSNNLGNSLFSTVFGRGDGDPDIVPSAFLIDVCDRIYVSGWGGQVNSGQPGSTTTGMPITPGAFQSFTDGSDFYFMVLDENGADLEYATYFGASGGGPEHVDGGTSRFDKKGVIYQAVCAGCGAFSSFPTTGGAWSQTNNSGNCNAGAIKFAFEPPLTIAASAVLPGAAGCAPFVVTFGSSSFNASELEWSIDGVVVSDDLNFVHTFTETGTYIVQLIASNNATCNLADTTISVITVIDPLSLTAEFTPVVDCINFTATFNPIETAGNHFWNLGNGQFATISNPSATYPSEGTYTITHIITSNVPNCPAADTVTQTILIAPPVTAQFVASDTLGCIPLAVQFNNTSINATEGYIWDLGNGQTSTDTNPTAIYTTEGTYTVSLTAANPESCNGTDIFVATVTALDTVIVADFAYTLPELCDPLTVQFATPLNPMLDFAWQFGDGTSAGDLTDVAHTYTAPGTYTALLIADSPCAEPDSVEYTFTIAAPPIVSGDIVLPPDSGCPPVDVSLQATGNGTAYTWLMGDGSTISGTTAVHSYTQSGIYTIQLIVSDPNTCNLADTTTTSVSVFEYADALFEMSTNIIELNDTVSFDNLSTNADSYLWNFGDGTSDTLFEPQHQFAQLGMLQVCLDAINTQQCNDQYCLPIQVIPVINIGVPTAFSPNGDNLNDILYVEGRANISLMTLRIFNRWGELVFETNDPQQGWDGTYRQSAQDMDAFAYTLVAQLVSGRQVTAQGNITLVR